MMSLALPTTTHLANSSGSGIFFKPHAKDTAFSLQTFSGISLIYFESRLGLANLSSHHLHRLSLLWMTETILQAGRILAKEAICIISRTQATRWKIRLEILHKSCSR
jgi:hypothetical protein